MPFTSFASEQTVKTVNTDEVVLGGGATFAAAGELKSLYLTMYSHGARASTDKIRVLLYHDAALTNLYATGDWAYLVEATEGAANWFGKVRCDFTPPVNIDAGHAYYVAIEPSGYTRNANASYISYAYDWPIPVNVNADDPRFALAMEMYMRRPVRY